MYTEKAIIRLNHIDWNHVGEEGRAEDMESGIDFLKKMADFCRQNNIIPSLPFMTDLASFFTDYEIDKDILEQCSYDVRNMIENPTFSTAIVKYYIKAAVLADEDAKYAVCMEIYDPIISLFEKGGNFVYRERGMSFIGSGLIPLAGWFQNFSEATKGNSKAEMLCRYIQQKCGYSEKRSRIMVDRMLPYNDIFEEFFNYACVGKFRKKDESPIEICGYTAEVLNRDFIYLH